MKQFMFDNYDNKEQYGDLESLYPLCRILDLVIIMFKQKKGYH